MRNTLQHPIDQHEVMDILDRLLRQEMRKELYGDLAPMVLQELKNCVFHRAWFEETFNPRAHFKWDDKTHETK